MQPSWLILRSQFALNTLEMDGNTGTQPTDKKVATDDGVPKYYGYQSHVVNIIGW